MGANCCISARNGEPTPIRSSVQISTNRIARYSPSWSVRWDNRRHVEDIVENHLWFSHGNREGAGIEIKSRSDGEICGLSDGASPFSSFQDLTYHQPPKLGKSCAKANCGEKDALRGSTVPDEGPMKSSISSNLSDSKTLTPVSSSTDFKSDTLSSHSFLSSDLTSSKKARRCPGFQIPKHVSVCRTPLLNPLNKNNSTVGDQYLVPPAHSTDLSMEESLGGSSDAWSVCMFSELIASSQRNRWTQVTENMSSDHNKITGYNIQVDLPPSNDDACSICSKKLKEISSWRSLEPSVVAVLVCGHVFHADCLEDVTSVVDKFDPSCPICSNGGKGVSMLKKADKAKSRISRTAVTDVSLQTSPYKHLKGFGRDGIGPKMWISSNLKKSFRKSFLKGHHNRSGSPSCSLSETEGTTKKGFWSRHRQEQLSSSDLVDR